MSVITGSSKQSIVPNNTRTANARAQGYFAEQWHESSQWNRDRPRRLRQGCRELSAVEWRRLKVRERNREWIKDDSVGCPRLGLYAIIRDQRIENPERNVEFLTRVPYCIRLMSQSYNICFEENVYSKRQEWGICLWRRRASPELCRLWHCMHF